MNITEHSGIILESRNAAITRVFGDNSGVKDLNAELISEYLLLVYINDRLSGQIVCTPNHLPELVAGRLITENGIDAGDILDIDICILGHEARVTVKEKIADKLVKAEDITPTCCTDNATKLFLDTDTDGLNPVTGGVIDKSVFPVILDRLNADTVLHSKTGSAHSCFLIYDNEIILEAEDIGRHNAVDKAVGHLAVKGYDRSRAALFTTGRMPVDMVRKVIRAGIPVLISKQQPTFESVELSQKYDLTLIGNLRKDHLDVYNGLNRIR